MIIRTNRKWVFDEHYFDKVDTEAKAYHLGLLYADGYNQEDKGTVHLSLVRDDIDTVRRFADEVRYKGPIRISPSRLNCDRKSMAILALQSRHMSGRLAELGCVQRKTHLLSTVPDLSSDLVRHFVRGYFDGDGSIYNAKDGRTSRGQFGLTITSTAAFCDSLARVIEEHVGVSMFANPKRRSGTATTTELLLQGAHNKIKLIMRWLYNDATIYMVRKYKKYLQLENREKIDNRRPVVKLDKHTGTTLKWFASVSEAAYSVGCDPDHIWYVASQHPYRSRGKEYVRHTAKGFRWQYV